MRYFLLTLILLIICYSSFPPIKRAIKSDTEKRGDKIVQVIQDYKITFGQYPDNLEHTFFDKVSKRAIVYRSFYYRKYKDGKNQETFEIRCLSFDGYDAYKYPNLDHWVYAD